MLELEKNFFESILDIAQNYSHSKKIDDLISYVILYSENPEIINKIVAHLTGQAEDTEFVSWNEVRVATDQELSSYLESLGSENPRLTAQLIKKMLSLIWESCNTCDLEPEPDELQNFLEKIPSKQIKNYAGCLLSSNNTITTWESNAQRVIKRFFGIIDSNLIKQKYSNLIIDRDNKICHKSIIIFGKQICKELQPECNKCPLNNNCKKMI